MGGFSDSQSDISWEKLSYSSTSDRDLDFLCESSDYSDKLESSDYSDQEVLLLGLGGEESASASVVTSTPSKIAEPLKYNIKRTQIAQDTGVGKTAAKKPKGADGYQKRRGVFLRRLCRFKCACRKLASALTQRLVRMRVTIPLVRNSSVPVPY